MYLVRAAAVNFTNIFCALFSYECPVFQLRFGFGTKISYEKHARKTLMKLTAGGIFINDVTSFFALLCNMIVPSSYLWMQKLVFCFKQKKLSQFLQYKRLKSSITSLKQLFDMRQCFTVVIQYFTPYPKDVRNAARGSF